MPSAASIEKIMQAIDQLTKERPDESGFQLDEIAEQAGVSKRTARKSLQGLIAETHDYIAEKRGAKVYYRLVTEQDRADADAEKFARRLANALDDYAVCVEGQNIVISARDLASALGLTFEEE